MSVLPVFPDKLSPRQCTVLSLFCLVASNFEKSLPTGVEQVAIVTYLFIAIEREADRDDLRRRNFSAWDGRHIGSSRKPNLVVQTNHGSPKKALISHASKFKPSKTKCLFPGIACGFVDAEVEQCFNYAGTLSTSGKGLQAIILN